MQIIDASQFKEYWKSYNNNRGSGDSASVDSTVREIIEAVRSEGDAALRRYAERFDKCSPSQIEVPFSLAEEAWKNFCTSDKEAAAALELAARHIYSFAELQKEQLADFEIEMAEGLFTGQRVIPVERAAVYVPAGRFPLFSSVLMGIIPALTAGVEEIILASPPMKDGFPDRNILAAAALSMTAGQKTGAQKKQNGKAKDTTLRLFAIGGAQAIAALTLGTESVPRASVIVGPGNKYVAAAKRMLFGEVGIDLIAGPTDVLVIAAAEDADAELIAADMLAQAEHDPEARARALVPSRNLAEKIIAAIEKQLAALPEESGAAKTSLENGGLIIIYQTREEAIRIANTIAPEHLELHVENSDGWINSENDMYLRNYGSLFIGSLAAEVLGDYSAGINHTLPTSGNARFTGGLSVRHFLKTPTTLRCNRGKGFEESGKAAEILGKAEGLAAHAYAALKRRV